MKKKTKRGAMRRYTCPGCNRYDILDGGHSHWCGCNPSAPFRMIDAEMSAMTDSIVRRLTASIRRGI